MARQTAQENLAKAALPSASVLLDIVSDWQRDTCETCGFPKGDPTPVIRAAQIVLDRTGFHPTLAVQAVRAPEIPDWMSWLSSGELEEMNAIRTRAIERMEAGAPREDEVLHHVIDIKQDVEEDAVLVDEETESEGE